MQWINRDVRRPWWSRGVPWLLAVAVVIAASGCGGGEGHTRPPEVEQQRAGLQKETSTRFVGRVPGTDALIGLTDRAGELSAYVCDSAQLAVWLSGQVSGTTLTAANGPAGLAGQRQGDDVVGTVTLPDGSVHAFKATRTSDPAAGLFQAFDIGEDRQLLRAGWVRLPDGEQRGAVKAGHVVRPVVPLAGQTFVVLGVTPTGTPVEPPMADVPVFCEVGRKEYWSAVDFYTELKAEGRLESAAIVLKRITGLDQVLEDYGCWGSGSVYSE